MDRLKELALLVQAGENVQAVSCAERLLADAYPVEKIVGALCDGLAVLRNKCTVENFQLLDVLLATRAMVEVVDECLARKLQTEMDILANAHEKSGSKTPAATLVIGTIQGDVHDLGKHVVATLCRFNGMRVVNLGKDVAVDRFVDAAIAESADFIGVSSLMTVCLGRIGKIKTELARRGRRGVMVVAGGGAAQQSSTERLNVDYVAHDAFDGLDFFLAHNGRAPD
jgi:methylmalonyl-CoA mutase cobalamin-binding domain/chain